MSILRRILSFWLHHLHLLQLDLLPLSGLHHLELVLRIGGGVCQRDCVLSCVCARVLSLTSLLRSLWTYIPALFRLASFADAAAVAPAP